MSARFQFSNVVNVLREPNFGIFVLGNSVSLIGTWMQRIAAGWLAWELTESTAWLGLIAFADLFPAVIIAPFAGVAADRWDRLKMMKLAQALGTALVALLTLLYFLGSVTIWVLFAFTLALSVVDSFIQPFRLAFVSALVPKAKLGPAVAIKSVTYNTARFIGPAMAGIIIVFLGVGWAFLVNALSFLVLLVALGRISIAPPERRPETGIPPSFLREAVEGVRYAFTSPGIGLVLILLTASCMAARPVVELLPGWAAAEFSGGAADLAALTSAIGFGAVAGGVWLAGRTNPLGQTRIFILCCFGLCATLLVFATAVTSTVAALPVMAVLGFFMITSAICAQTLIQLNVADWLRGRVLSVYALVLRGSPAFGALAMGFAAEFFGLRWPFVVASVLLLAIVMLVGRIDRLTAVLERKFRASEPSPDGASLENKPLEHPLDRHGGGTRL